MNILTVLCYVLSGRDISSRKRKRESFESSVYKSMAMSNTVYGPNCPVRGATPGSQVQHDVNSSNKPLGVEGRVIII